MRPKTPTNPEQLRADAESRLRSRSAPSSAGWTINTETLSLLYRLASDPDSGSDALKLLHELQTHQVELDLQHVQLMENDQELSARLAHYQCLYEEAPAGYLVLDRDGRILQSNQAATRLFGLDVGQLKGHFLASLLSPDNRQALKAMLDDPGSASQIVQVLALDSRRLRLVYSIATQDDAILVMVFPEALAVAN